MKLNTLLSACAIGLILSACAAETEPVVEPGMADKAAEAAGDAAEAAGDAMEDAGKAMEDHADHDH